MVGFGLGVGTPVVSAFGGVGAAEAGGAAGAAAGAAAGGAAAATAVAGTGPLGPIAKS